MHKDLLFFHVSLANNSHVPFDVDFNNVKIEDLTDIRKIKIDKKMCIRDRSYTYSMVHTRTISLSDTLA